MKGKSVTVAARQLKHLGGRIRVLRKDMGATQAVLARRAGIDPRYYSRIERGQVNATFQTLMRLTRALRVCPGVLFFPASRLDESMAAACACVSQMKSTGRRRQLDQVVSFARHVLGVRPRLKGARRPQKKTGGKSSLR
ncbi:helix-turn-helix transcriptional regulator [bacterium]|nr:helix-turn-helix transcriptional regulator [bacterium]